MSSISHDRSGESDASSFQSRFRFIDDPPSAETFNALLPQLFDVEERATGREYVLKLWRKTATALDEDLRQLWRHEMRQVERVMASAGAHEVIVDVLDVIEDRDYFGVLLDPAGKPLDVLLRKVSRQHWLKNLGSTRARTLLWRNVRRIATGLGLVHAQGLVHGRLEASAVITEGADTPDFRLSGFEWSLWISAEGMPVAQAHLDSPGTLGRAPYSFAADWRALGKLIGASLGLSIGPSGDVDAVDPNRDVELTAAEHRLLRRLVAPDRLDLLEAGSIRQGIDDLLVGIGREMSSRSGAFILAFDRTAQLAEVVYDASHGGIARDDYRQQLQWARADIMNGVTLLIPRDFDPSRSKMRLVSNTTIYTLRALQESGAAVWDVAVCSRVEARGETLPLRDGREHALPQPIETVASVREARELRGQLASSTLDWSAFAIEPVPRSYLNPTEGVRRSLLLIQVVEAFLKALEIYPVEIVRSAVSARGRSVQLRARAGSDRDRLARRIGIPDTVAALRHLLEEDRNDAPTKWTLSTSSTLGVTLESDVTARFVDVVDTNRGYAYLFEIDEALPRNATLYLRTDRDRGSEHVIRRRLRNIRALETRVDLAEMLDDPWRVRRSSRETIGVSDQEDAEFLDLDESKRQALMGLWETLPSFSVVGPPGVGKTKLATETIRRRFVQSRATRMLLTAQGHDALDNLEAALKKVIYDAELRDLIVVRSTTPDSRPSGGQEVHLAGGEYLRGMEQSALVRNAPAPLRERVSGLARAVSDPANPSDTVSREERSGLRAVSNLLLDGANIVLSTLNSPDVENLVEARDQFDWVIVEEAAKATGPELTGALMLSGRRLLIGDHFQLPPFQAERYLRILRDQGLITEAVRQARRSEGSLLEENDVDELKRIVDDPTLLASVAEQALQLFEPFRTIVVEDERRTRSNSGHRPISSTLTEQRRMDPAIARVVSNAFYDGKLTTEANRAVAEQQGAQRFEQRDPLPSSPVVVIDFPHVSLTGMRQGFERSRPRWHNPSEVDAVTDVLRHVSARRGETPKLAVLSPYAAQVDRLEQRVSELLSGTLAHLKKFSPARPGGFVGTVDSFQGSEADLVVLSLVRNNPRVGGPALGFLRDRRRINVALSRAMSQLIIVGSLAFLHEAVRGINPDGEEHDLSFLTVILKTIDALTKEKRADGVPLAAVIPHERLRTR